MPNLAKVDDVWHTVTVDLSNSADLYNKLGGYPYPNAAIQGTAEKLRFDWNPQNPGQYFDLAYVGFFKTEEEATHYGLYTGTDPVVIEFNSMDEMNSWTYKLGEATVPAPAEIMTEDNITFARVTNFSYMQRLSMPKDFDVSTKPVFALKYRMSVPFTSQKNLYFGTSVLAGIGQLVRLTNTGAMKGGDNKWTFLVCDVTDLGSLRKLGSPGGVVSGIMQRLTLDFRIDEGQYIDLAYAGFFESEDQLFEYDAQTKPEAIVFNFDEQSDIDDWQYFAAGGVLISPDQLDGKVKIMAENGVSFARINSVGYMTVGTYDLVGADTSTYDVVSVRYRLTSPKDRGTRRTYLSYRNMPTITTANLNFTPVINGEWATANCVISSYATREHLMDVILTELRLDTVVSSGQADDYIDLEYVALFKTLEDAQAYAARRETLDFALETLGAQVRSDDKPGLRFGSKLSNYDESLYDDFEFGTLLLPAKILGDDELTIDTELAAVIPAVNIYESDDTGDTFTAVLTGIGDNEEVEIVARPYVRYKHMDTYSYVYGDAITRSMKSFKDAAAEGWLK